MIFICFAFYTLSYGRMIELVELNTGGPDRGDRLCNLLVSTVHLLGAGVARWVTSLSSLVVANPSSSHLLALVPHICQTCPEAMARELGTLLPALLKQAYSLSWKDPSAIEKKSSKAQHPPLYLALSALVATDLDQATLLCQGLKEVKVNPAFDALVDQLEMCT